MRLTPCIFMRTNVGGFAKITCTRISPWHYISRLHQDPVRHTVVNMTGVVVGIRGKRSGEWIDPGARADEILVAIEA